MRALPIHLASTWDRSRRSAGAIPGSLCAHAQVDPPPSVGAERRRGRSRSFIHAQCSRSHGPATPACYRQVTPWGLSRWPHMRMPRRLSWSGGPGVPAARGVSVWCVIPGPERCFQTPLFDER